MKFAANNRYATDTSTGFANTWYVLAFEDQQSRDAYVSHAQGLAVKAIAKAEISRYVPAPKPFTVARRAIGLAASEISTAPGTRPAIGGWRGIPMRSFKNN